MCTLSKVDDGTFFHPVKNSIGLFVHGTLRPPVFGHYFASGKIIFMMVIPLVHTFICNLRMQLIQMVSNAQCL